MDLDDGRFGRLDRGNRPIYLSLMADRVLITGGAGFIGSHLAERLLADGHQRHVLDDLSTGRRENIAGLLGTAGIPSSSAIRSRTRRRSTLLMSPCDAVFHLASAVGVQLILDEPVRTIRTTIHGTEVVLEAANRFGRPVLITSSSEVYGKGTPRAVQRGRRRGDGPHALEPLVLRVLQGDRRVPRPGVPQAVRPAGDDRPAVQHGRPAAGRACTAWCCRAS